ncbi:hypothetical protein TEA_002443 [Camellia sinensis var. sinensis]|uniref:Phosphofructokinase domain-containing protein n=1 Tax=Camellia sinensis var. sinensis TaxID=542762 RepID=A0A4S4DDY4_CAMSN|nr:hypothetical protein TEA_002443 [Camellia sinensis var. sinensis]
MTFTHTSYAVLSLRANRVITSVGDTQALVALVLQQVTTSPPIDPLTINSWKYYNHNHGNGLLFFYQDHYSQVSLLRPCDFDIVFLAFQLKFSGSKGVMGTSTADQRKIVTGDNGYVLEDVPHLSDYIPDLPYPRSIGIRYGYDTDTSPYLKYPCFIDPSAKSRGRVLARRRFRCAPWDFGGLGNLEAIDGDFILKLCYATWTLSMNLFFTRQYFVNEDDTVAQQVYFESDEVHASIVTCGGLCPGINTVIREIVCGLYYMYGVNKVLGIEGGYRGFYSRNTIPLTPKVVNDIHKRGGTILGTSRGGHETSKIVDSIQDRGITQEIKRRGLKVAVAGIPKTIDNDIPVIDKSFGFDAGVEETQRAINAAHVEAESFENGVGVVKLMGRYSGPGGLFEFMEKRLKENGHMVIVIAEGAGQELLSESMHTMNQQDASENKLLEDVGLWISQKIKDHFNKQKKVLNLKYIDPTYMIRAIPSIASDNVNCTLLAQSAIHGAMAGYTGFTVGPVNGKHAYIPFYRVTERQNKVVITDRMWARLLSLTNQPSFLNPKDIIEAKKEEQPKTQLLDGDSVSDEPTSKDNGKSGQAE